MQSGMVLVWIGALLIICGIVLAAGRVLWQGRLSDARRLGATGASATLEPQGRGRALHPKMHWPSIALVALGLVLILAETAI
jgi:hypothetical protein